MLEEDHSAQVISTKEEPYSSQDLIDSHNMEDRDESHADRKSGLTDDKLQSMLSMDKDGLV
jgi:hypothetical protein